MCVDEQVVGESGLGGSTEEEHEPDRGRCELDIIIKSRLWYKGTL